MTREAIQALKALLPIGASIGIGKDEYGDVYFVYVQRGTTVGSIPKTFNGANVQVVKIARPVPMVAT